jgi:hypothetical protein
MAPLCLLGIIQKHYEDLSSQLTFLHRYVMRGLILELNQFDALDSCDWSSHAQESYGPCEKLLHYVERFHRIPASILTQRKTMSKNLH